MFTGKGREEVVVKALNLGADSYINKNGSPETVYCELADAINKTVKHKKAEEAVRKSEERYRELANFLPEIVFEADLTGKITFFSQRAFEITGFTQEKLEKGVNMLSFVVPEERERAKENIKKALLGKEREGQEYTLYKKNGVMYPAIVKTAAIISENKVTGLRGLVIDITELKKAEEAIKFQADLLNHVGQAIIMVDNNRIIRFWNKAAEKLYGWSEEQALGHKVTELLGGSLPEEADEVAKRLMAGESWSTEVLAKNRDGSVVPVILNRTPIFKEDGEFVGAASIATDITLQKNTEADLTFSLISLSNSLDKIQELNEKLRVVGSLTRHDVRNKLSAVTGYAYILKKKHSDQADIVDGLSKMEQAVKETVKIFDFAKMYEQIGVEELTYVNVEEKLKEAVALFSGPIPR